MKLMSRLLASCGLAAALLAGAALQAAPTVYRLTPPSTLFSFNDALPPIIARFLPGQFFDLQCTVAPDSGQTITGVQFFVDNIAVTGTVSNTAATVTTITNVVASVAVNIATPTNTQVFSLRHYANNTAGVHTLKVIATQSDAQTVQASGNFEVQAINTVGRRAKNIIILIGDGMGAAHRTAARIMSKGVQMGKAVDKLAMDKFPVTGMVETASLNSIVPDSAPGASCYSTGNKGNNNQLNVFPDDTLADFDNPRVETIGEFLARTGGKSLGIITTADVFDATPAAFGPHTAVRADGTGICDQYLDEIVPFANLKVLMGGGRKWFLPNTTIGSGRTSGTDSVLPADIANAWGRPVGALDPTRDLLSDFQTAGFTYAPDRTSLNAISNSTDKLIGLFTFSNMNVAKDKIDGRRNNQAAALSNTVVGAYGFPDQPMLDEMADKALQVLSKNLNGFVLMIEGASIDKQSHNMDPERSIEDVIEFDNAVEKCRQFQIANPDTLVIITADHECGGLSVIGSSMVTNASLTTRAASGGGAAQLRTNVVGTFDNAKFPQYPLNADGYPTSTDVDFKMLIGWAANADRNEDWLTNPLPLRDSQQPTSGTPYGSIVSTLPNLPINRDTAGAFAITGQIADTTAAHTANDIPLSALGRGSVLFTGYMDNTDVFFKMMQATLGGSN